MRPLHGVGNVMCILFSVLVSFVTFAIANFHDGDNLKLLLVCYCNRRSTTNPSPFSSIASYIKPCAVAGRTTSGTDTSQTR